MLLDRARHHRRLQRRGIVVGRRRVSGERRARQPNPELRRAPQRHLVLLLRRVIVEQLETIVRQRVQAHVVPLPRELVGHESEWTLHAPRVHRQRRQHLGDLGPLDAPRALHGAEVMPMKLLRELL